MTLMDERTAPAAPPQQQSERLASLTITGSAAEPTTWDPTNAGQVKIARQLFDAYRGRGYLGYAADPGDPSSGEQLRTFDPHARQIVMTRPLQGG